MVILAKNMVRMNLSQYWHVCARWHKPPCKTRRSVCSASKISAPKLPSKSTTTSNTDSVKEEFSFCVQQWRVASDDGRMGVIAVGSDGGGNGSSKW